MPRRRSPSLASQHRDLIDQARTERAGMMQSYPMENGNRRIVAVDRARGADHGVIVEVVRTPDGTFITQRYETIPLFGEPTGDMADVQSDDAANEIVERLEVAEQRTRDVELTSAFEQIARQAVDELSAEHVPPPEFQRRLRERVNELREQRRLRLAREETERLAAQRYEEQARLAREGLVNSERVPPVARSQDAQAAFMEAAYPPPAETPIEATVDERAAFQRALDRDIARQDSETSRLREAFARAAAEAGVASVALEGFQSATVEPSQEVALPAPQQFQLLPDIRPEARQATIQLDRCDIPPTFPEAEFVESIRRMGVLQPIAVIQNGRTGRFTVAAGRRRVAAARQLEFTEIPALVFAPGTPPHIAAAMALTENLQRRPNPLTDLVAIERMVAAGSNEAQIATELRVPVATVRSRMRLARLIPALRQRLEQGQIAPTVAEAVARMPSNEQEMLNGQAIAAGDGVVTARMVRALREVVTTEQVEAIPEAAFRPGPIVAGDRPTPLTDSLAAALEQGRRLGREEALAARAEIAAGNQPVTLIRVADAEDAESWPHVLAYLQAAQRALPAGGQEVVDQIYVEVSSLVDRVQLIITPAAPAARRPRARAAARPRTV